MLSARLEGWNLATFAAINADANSPQGLLVLARAVAESAPFVAALMVVLLWVRKGPEVRLRLLDATVTAGIGLCVAQVIARLWYHPRPFELGLGHQYLAHVPEASFPSDHATLLFGLALPLLAAVATREWGLVFLMLALVTAWARIYLGVHFPLDMLGGLGIAIAVWGLVAALRGPLHGRLYPAALGLYDWGLRKLRLPKALFPRR
ncbi:MAG: undecaprenyl-diphosphatase [Rhodobacterales bacterium]|nr:undecaprenyl-diphosphatase [Rhodobacterales bacterium]